MDSQSERVELERALARVDDYERRLQLEIEHSAYLEHELADVRAKLERRSIWSRVIRWFVTDVPAELDECERCREVDCDHERAEQCPRHLAALAHRGPAKPTT